MRHGCKVNHLSRTHAHRVAMLSNMASSLILHKRIETTVAKAKALRVYVEPLITRSKVVNTANAEDEQYKAALRNNHRVAFSYLHNKQAVHELFSEVGPKVANRNGGYTRILKTGIRHGDNSEMCIIELVDYNENMLKTPKKAKATRRGRGKKAETTPTNEVVENAAEPVDAVNVEASDNAKAE
ncbi:MAG: 50S ribosomal protein L17 [Bacteroidales bacterium]|nr:50S ribosomal protein L17 [Bacteroidales bacterium]